jgi:DNA-binding MarR family transcriptional regulator/GNAT superfamily N-acetyltransferase
LRTSGATGNDVAVFRRINRMYTRYLGTLNEVWLVSDFSLPEARVIYELATRTAPQAKAIAEDLGMDAGYLSRLLGKFERAGLLKRKRSAHDGRSHEITLTPRGKSAFRKLNAMSEREAQRILDDLPPSARAQLIESMQTMERLLAKDGKNRPPCILRPHRIGDMGWIVYREGLGYAEEFGWDNTFEALVARIVDHFITNFDASRERCWIAEVDGQNVGHIFLVKHPEEPGTAKLRLLFVEPSTRGMGLGHVLVMESIRFAHTAGYRKVTLWTQSMLVAAHRIYQAAGFRLVREEPHHSFGKDLVGQVWELDLT